MDIEKMKNGLQKVEAQANTQTLKRPGARVRGAYRRGAQVGLLQPFPSKFV